MAGRPLQGPTKRSRGTAGFLLTETLATFTISAFVLLGLVSASSVLLRAVDRSVAHVQDVDDLGRTMGALARDISGLTRARWNGYEPQPFVFRGGPNSLFFARAEHEPAGSGETVVIALREIVVGTGTRLMRSEARLSAKATGFGGLRFGPPRELGTGPARLRFYYIKAARGKAGQTRVRDWPVVPLLPAAIIVEAVDRETGRLLVSTRLPIRANADIGCLPRAKNAAPTGTGVAVPGAPPSNPGGADPEGAGAPHVDGDDDFCGRIDKDDAGKPNGTGPAAVEVTL